MEWNYLEVYPYDKWGDKEIPHYEQGQQFEPSEIEMVDGQTTPPPLLTEADLIALMEKHGIGESVASTQGVASRGGGGVFGSVLFFCTRDQVVVV